MDELSVLKYIREALPEAEAVEASGNYFFFRNTDGLPKDHRFPFATLVVSDEYDHFSNLNRPGVFRLNIGLSKVAFDGLLGAAATSARDGTYDYTALDTFMPHPVYGKMHWVCVLNPSDATFNDTVKGLLAEAYDRAKK